MPPIYVKPENALKRSEELLALGTSQSQQQAFENLVEVFQSKRFKHTPVNVLEPIMIKFIELCVEMNRKSHARAGLLAYRNAAQTTSVSSIETVLNHFIAQAEARLTSAVEQARSEVSALPESPVVDDELPLQPSAMLVDSFLDTAGDRERIERRLIAPAQKFCGDSYDISLDVCKGNDRLEVIYQSIAHRAFSFCKAHQRKTDFRRLCEQRLRKDLGNANKYAHQAHAVNLSDPDTLSRYLETRFLQLETAAELELWQEAFRSVEDIHGLVTGKKLARPSQMANYYEKLTQIFRAEGGKQTAVFHAAAWARYYQHAERISPVPEEASACVLLSAMAVPLGAVETKPRLVALLNLPKMPTRDVLVQDAAAKHLKRVSSDIRQLYNILEVDFQPFNACKALAPLITSLSADFQPYLPALHEVVLSRLLQDLSQVYETVTIAHIVDLVEPFNNTPWSTDLPALEKFLMTACHRGDINATVDHVARSITFAAAPSEGNRLSNLAVTLYNTIQYLKPAPVQSRADVFAAAIAQAEEEQKQTAHRRQIVKKRRELMEEANLRREREESTMRAERAKQLAEDRTRQEKEMAKQAEMDRLQKQIDATRREEAKKLAESLGAKGKLKVDISGIEDLDSSKLVAMQVEQLAKEKREMNDRLRIVAKRVDHLERALRKEERPLLVEDYERQKEEDKVSHERANVTSRQQAIEHQKATLELKNRLARMMPDYLDTRQATESQQETELQKSREAATRKIDEEKARFKAQVIARRQAERDERERRRVEEEEEERQRLDLEEEEARQADEREEEERQAREAIEARKAEEVERAAKQRAERDAERAAAAEAARKQMEREEEADRRRRERSTGGPLRRTEPAPASPAATSVASTLVKPGTWRERQAEKERAGVTATPPAPSPVNGVSAVNGHATPEGEAPAPERGSVYRRGMGMRGRGGGSSTPPTSARSGGPGGGVGGGSGGASGGGSRW